MRAYSRVPWLLLLALPLLSACQQPQGLFGTTPAQQAQVQQFQQQQLAAAQQQQQLQAAASTVDRLNQEKEQQLAASRQDVQRLQARVDALAARLKETSAMVVREQGEKQTLQKSYEELMAANRRSGTTTISANSNRGVNLTAIQIRGVDVRRDGDVVRVTLPANQLFNPGTAQLTTSGGNLLDTVATEVNRSYPRQLIGVEGHADGGGPGAPGQNATQFSTLRALATYNYLISRGSLRADQLHVTGHGNKHPVYSTATPAGQEANQRVELVVYPETMPAQ